MTAGDIVVIAVPMIAGLTLVARSWPGLFAGGKCRGIRTAVARLHASAQRRAVEAGLFRFPGACLVASTRPWIAGEAVFLGTFGAVLSRGASFPNGLAALAAAALLGGGSVYLGVRSQSRRQLAEIVSSLPVASFLMSLLLEAGMGSYAALREATRALPPGPLVRELDELARSRMIGIPRSEAIERSRRRIPLEDYRTFLNLIEQGERLGVGLAQALREHSSKMMEAQGHRAETLAQRAAVKLLLPLVVFIFPAVFLVILSPVILSLCAMFGR